MGYSPPQSLPSCPSQPPLLKRRPGRPTASSWLLSCEANFFHVWGGRPPLEGGVGGTGSDGGWWKKWGWRGQSEGRWEGTFRVMPERKHWGSQRQHVLASWEDGCWHQEKSIQGSQRSLIIWAAELPAPFKTFQEGFSPKIELKMCWALLRISSVWALWEVSGGL